MNRDAFYAGVEIEFHKLASAGNKTVSGSVQVMQPGQGPATDTLKSANPTANSGSNAPAPAGPPRLQLAAPAQATPTPGTSMVVRPNMGHNFGGQAPSIDVQSSVRPDTSMAGQARAGMNNMARSAGNAVRYVVNNPGRVAGGALKGGLVGGLTSAGLDYVAPTEAATNQDYGHDVWQNLKDSGKAWTSGAAGGAAVGGLPGAAVGAAVGGGIDAGKKVYGVGRELVDAHNFNSELVAHKDVMKNLVAQPIPNNVSPARQALLQEQQAARQEAGNLPSTWDAFGSLFKSDADVQKQVVDRIKGWQPGQQTGPQVMSTEELLGADIAVNNPKILAAARQAALDRANQHIKDTSVFDLAGQSGDKLVGGNNVLGNNIEQYLRHDKDAVGSLSKSVAGKTYGAFGLKDGLNPDFTPGNFQFGNFAKDHWGKLLAGGGLLAALMWAMKGGGQQQQQQPIVINNGYPQQQQRRELPGYAG